MSEIVLNIVYEFANLFILVNFFLSFRINKRYDRFKLFKIYLSLSLLEVAFVDIVRLTSLRNFIDWFYPSIIFTTIHFAILSQFIIQELSKNKKIYYALYTLIIFFLIIIKRLLLQTKI